MTVRETNGSKQYPGTWINGTGKRILLACIVVVFVILSCQVGYYRTFSVLFYKHISVEELKISDKVNFLSTAISKPKVMLNEWRTSLQTSSNGSDGVTVVSAYFNLGTFIKGHVNNNFTADMYHRWMTSFALVSNPMVIYLDSSENVDLLTRIRRNFPENITRIIKVDRSKLWSFGLKERIAKVFARDAYPRHLPNTVVPEYSMATHAKYELMLRTIVDNPFNTKYVCWLDVGLFRDLVTSDVAVNMSTSNPFKLTIPPDLNLTSVAYTEVNSRTAHVNATHIVYHNLVWVCGCYFIGRVDIMLQWTIEYMTGVEDMLDINEMSTDQQVIYWIFNRGKPRTSIQTYKGDGRFNEWFHLGFASRKYKNG